MGAEQTGTSPWTLARYRLGDLEPEEMPGIALQALEAGYDGPSLLEFASMSSPTAPRTEGSFERALEEAGLPPPPKDEAGLRWPDTLPAR